MKRRPISQAKPQAPAPAPKEEELIPVNGFAQVVALLQHAEPEFRDSLLRRIGVRDKKLAHALKVELDLV